MCYTFVMPQRLSAFRLPEEIVTGLQRIKERDGIPISEQVRRALSLWVKAKEDARPARRRRAKPTTEH